MRTDLYSINIRFLLCLIIILSTITTSFADNKVVVSVLYDFDTGKPSILDMTNGKVKAPPVHNNQPKEEYNNLVKKLGDIIYDGIPALVVSSGFSTIIDTPDILQLAGKNISQSVTHKDVIVGDELYPGRIILIKTLKGKYALCKIIQINRKQLKVAWISQSKNTTVFSKDKLLALKNVPLDKQENSRKMILSRVYQEGNDAIDFNKQKSVKSFLPNNEIISYQKHTQLLEQLSQVADVALVNKSSPALLVASGEMVILGNGLLANYSRLNLQRRFLSGKQSDMLSKIELDTVLLIKDRLDNYVLIRVIGLDEKNVELHWVYQPNGTAIFSKLKNEINLIGKYSQKKLNEKLFSEVMHSFKSDIKSIRKLITLGADINATNNLGHTVLAEAALNEDLQVISILCDSNVNINAKDERGLTALHMAVSSGKFDAVKLLVEKGADPNIADFKGRAALEIASDIYSDNKGKIIKYLVPLDKSIDSLLIAAKVGKDKVVQKLLDDGADINQVDHQGRFPLYFAAEVGNVETVKLLLQNGADLAIEASNGRGDALAVAARTGQRTVVEILLKNKKINELQKAKALEEATLYKNIEIVKLLLKEKTDPNLKINGRSSYEVSLQYPSKQITELYLERGFKLPLWAAAKIGRVDDIQRLIESGADVNEIKSPDGESNLDLAIKSKKVEVVELLMKHGVDINAKNSTRNKNTPLHTAVDIRRSDIVQLLIENGANLNTTNFYERTPLVLAVIKHDLESVKLLLKNNADFTLVPETYESIFDVTRNKEMKKLLSRYAITQVFSKNFLSAIMLFLKSYWYLIFAVLITWLMLRKKFSNNSLSKN